MSDIAQMNKEEMRAFYERLSELTKEGTEQEVREYINDHYVHLPEEVRTEILFNLMRTSVEEQALEERTIDAIQTEGLAAAEIFEDIQKGIQKAEGA